MQDPSHATSNIPFEVITVGANQRYRFRLINSFCTVCPAQLTIEGHRLTVIASDGQPMQPVVVDSIVSLAGTILIKMQNSIINKIVIFI